MALTVGIDLGTTYSVVAYVDPITKSTLIIKNKYGFNTTPSALAFFEDGKVEIGSDAKKEIEDGNPNTASFYKLEMGKKHYSLNFFGKEYTARDLSAVFLKELIAQAEASIGQKIDKAVITVPAYFEDLERNNTIHAGNKAGLEVLNVINEPTAAAIAYGLKDGGETKNILIYDLGGGTFDVTIARITADSVDVIGSSGKHFLGGKNWDEAIANWVLDQFEEEFGISFAEDKDAFNTLMVKAENAKRILSSSEYTDITIKYDGYKGNYRLTEEIFRECSASYLDITKKTIELLFEDVGLKWSDINGVILVGGSTKMKMVKDYIIEMTGKPPLGGVHPDEAVAIGAAIQASIDQYCGKGKKLGFLAGIEKNQYNMKSLPGAKFINDVIAHSLGMISVSADNKKFINDIMIKKNTPVKNASVTKRRELTVSRKEELNELEIYLLQGEMENPLDCTVAKKYVFNNISYVEGGKTRLDITYSYTLNGTIAIEAKQTENNQLLECREENVPDDMSWVLSSPEEYFSQNIVPVTGALYMALDMSGSMSGRPLTLAKKAMKNFVMQFDLNNIKIGIIGFANSIQVCTKATSKRTEILKAIDSLKIGDKLGYGNSAEPLTQMRALLNEYRGDPFLYAIVLTDGMWSSGACNGAIKQKDLFVRDGYEVVGLGFGSADEKFLKKISTRDELASVDDISNLDSKLSKIAKVINEN